MRDGFRSREIIGIITAFVLDIILWFLFIFGPMIAGVVTGLFVKEAEKGAKISFIGGLFATLVIVIVQIMTTSHQLGVISGESVLIVSLVNMTALVIGGFVGGTLRE